jgi:hypothetical protein
MANGTTGIVTVTTFTQLAGASRPVDVFALLDWFAPRLLAQGTATGALSLVDGTVVTLSGTTSGNTVQMSGAGGYSVSLTASGASLSGTVSAPQGSGSVSAIPSVGVGASVPSNPAGTYSGNVSLFAPGFYYNRIISNGVLERNCGYNTTITGPIKVTVLGADSKAPGRWNVEYVEQLQYKFQIVAPCPDVTQFESTANTAPSSSPPRVSADLANFQIAFSNAAPIGGGSDTTLFVATMTGTTINGRLTKARRFSINPVPNNEHVEGWPPTDATVVLQKQ